MNEIIINVYNDEVNVGVEEIIETVTIVITENAGGAVDVPIETISANGVPIPIVNKNVDIIIPTKTSDLEKDDVYTKTEIDNKLTAIYKFKGSVLTYAELPTDAENADVYNVEENGVNYAWVQATESWDSLGGLVGLATLTENGLLSKEDFAKLVNLSGTNTGDETQDSLGEKIELTELETITDTTKIAASDSAFLKWFSGLTIYTYLKGKFDLVYATIANLALKANLSGGNIFSGKQDFDGMINHKVGEYFYTAASKTADTVNDTRVINTAGVEIHSICTVLGATKGGGTWIQILQIDTNGNFGIKKIGASPTARLYVHGDSGSDPDLFRVYSVRNGLGFYVANDGHSKFTGNLDISGSFRINDLNIGASINNYLRLYLTSTAIGNIFGWDGLALHVNEGEVMRIIRPGHISVKNTAFQYSAASPTADTINDTRTVNTSGLWELFKCSLGNVTKGLGTWIYGRLKLGMVIETEINEYADNAAALAAGLTAGMKYRTGDLYKIVH